MSRRKSLPGKFVWFEHLSHDPKKAQAFYAEALGWTARGFQMGEGTYDMIYAGDKMLGGYSAPADDEPAHWMSFVSVEDVDEVVKRAVEGGGKVITGPYEVPGIARRAIIADPQGAVVSLFSSYADDPPDAYAAKQGEFFWNELCTTDPEKAVAFYEKVIGYTHESMDATDGGKYRVLSLGGVGRGGVSGRLDQGAAPHWMPYVYADDPDQTIARAKELGGVAVVEPTDIPDIGRFSVLRDPTGAVLAVMKPRPMRRPA